MAKTKEGNILTDEKDIINRWKQYFEELTEKSTEEQELETAQVGLTEISSIQLITEEEVIQALNKIKIWKATGQDDITTEMLKFMGTEAKAIFTDLLNSIFRTKIIPQD